MTTTGSTLTTNILVELKDIINGFTNLVPKFRDNLDMIDIKHLDIEDLKLYSKIQSEFNNIISKVNSLINIVLPYVRSLEILFNNVNQEEKIKAIFECMIKEITEYNLQNLQSEVLTLINDMNILINNLKNEKYKNTAIKKAYGNLQKNNKAISAMGTSFIMGIAYVSKLHLITMAIVIAAYLYKSYENNKDVEGKREIINMVDEIISKIIADLEAKKELLNKISLKVNELIRLLKQIKINIDFGLGAKRLLEEFHLLKKAASSLSKEITEKQFL